MSEQSQTHAKSDTGTDPLPPWLTDLMPGGKGVGFLRKGRGHTLMHVARKKPILLVTFDNLSNVGDTSTARAPWAYKFAQDLNLSHLGVMAHVKAWYRDGALIDEMQRLADDGFFARYERVVFAGTSMGGFAALAFAKLAPGSHVIAFSPQTTLDTDLVPWESRFWSGRRQDWSLPLSDGAQTIEDCAQVNVIYDPYNELDRKHAERVQGPNVRHLKCFYANHKTPVYLRRMGTLKDIMELGVMGELSEARFYSLLRARRSLPWYRGNLEGYFRAKDRPEMADRVARAFFDAKAQVDSEPDQIPFAARRLKNDRRTIVTTMKNEGPFMLEWIAYNRAIGFTDFHIYTNDCDDGTDAIAMRLEELGIARHYVNTFREGQSPQRTALRRAYRLDEVRNSDWVLCADCDEFLNISAGDGTLDDLFEAVGDTDAISLVWRTFGFGGVRDYEDRFVIDQFNWAAPEVYFDKYRANGLKTLFRPCEDVIRMGVHRPKFDGISADFVWRDAGGQRMPKAYFRSGWSAHRRIATTHARLHHYAVRSADSFLVKRDRGRTNHIYREQGLEYWADMNLSMVEDRSIHARRPGLQAEFDRLMADPELARLHAAAVDWHQGRIDALKADPDWMAFQDQIVEINKPGQNPVDKSTLPGVAPE